MLSPLPTMAAGSRISTASYYGWNKLMAESVLISSCSVGTDIRILLGQSLILQYWVNACTLVHLQQHRRLPFTNNASTVQ